MQKNSLLTVMIAAVLLMAFLSSCKKPSALKEKRKKDTNSFSVAELETFANDPTSITLREMGEIQLSLDECVKACQGSANFEACVLKCEEQAAGESASVTDTIGKGGLPDPPELLVANFQILNLTSGDTIGKGGLPDPEGWVSFSQFSFVDAATGDTISRGGLPDPEEDGQDKYDKTQKEDTPNQAKHIPASNNPPTRSRRIILIDQATARPYLSLASIQNLVVPGMKKPYYMSVVNLKDGAMIFESNPKKLESFQLLTIKKENYWRANAVRSKNPISGPVRVVVCQEKGGEVLLDAEVILVPADNWKRK